MSSPVLAQIMVWIVEMQEVVPAFARLELWVKRFSLKNHSRIVDHFGGLNRER
jgi:hypothetical protein